MLSGRRAFHVSPAAETMSRFWKEDPLSYQTRTRACRRLTFGEPLSGKEPGSTFSFRRDLAFALESLLGIRSYIHSIRYAGDQVATNETRAR